MQLSLAIEDHMRAHPAAMYLIRGPPLVLLYCTSIISPDRVIVPPVHPRCEPALLLVGHRALTGPNKKGLAMKKALG